MVIKSTYLHRRLLRLHRRLDLHQRPLRPLHLLRRHLDLHQRLLRPHRPRHRRLDLQGDLRVDFRLPRLVVLVEWLEGFNQRFSESYL